MTLCLRFWHQPLVRSHCLTALAVTVIRITGGAKFGHFVMAVTGWRARAVVAITAPRGGAAVASHWAAVPAPVAQFPHGMRRGQAVARSPVMVITKCRIWSPSVNRFTVP
jgi:hypothetical protein